MSDINNKIDETKITTKTKIKNFYKKYILILFIISYIIITTWFYYITPKNDIDIFNQLVIPLVMTGALHGVIMAFGMPEYYLYTGSIIESQKRKGYERGMD
jgi:hypothetical protein